MALVQQSKQAAKLPVRKDVDSLQSASRAQAGSIVSLTSQVAPVPMLVSRPIAASSSTTTSTETVSVVATADIPAFVAVTSSGVPANSSNLAHRGKVIGISTAAILTGFSGSVQFSGSIANAGWSWATGDDIFLNGTGLSNSAPGTGFVQQVGIAVGPSTVLITVEAPILL